jgi:hypothetical protein
LGRLCAFVDQWLTRTVKYQEDDHFGFMVLFFLSKQRTHARSILALQGSRDVLLIARSMIKGLFLLLWTGRSPLERALQWRALSLVHDWRLLRAARKAGRSFNPAMWVETEERLHEHEGLLLTSKAKAAHARGAPLPDDPYHRRWPPIPFKEVVKEIGTPDLYEGLYGDLAPYHHWEIAGLTRSLRRGENTVHYSGSHPADETTGLICAISCLAQTAQLANDHHGIAPKDELEALRAEALEICQKHGTRR